MSEVPDGAFPERKPWRHGAACVIAHFRLTPKSSKDAVEGVTSTSDGPAFQARVRAVPEHGAANEALEVLVARWLNLPKRSVSLASGGKSRLKALRIDGEPEALDRLLQMKISEFQR
ncbi:MAG TPA: DUF167 family protein [Hyphomicrobium sp.]|nr:DUF167 family protein [Hyphomicrobium sp.]